jgi:hypothetical protein
MAVCRGRLRHEMRSSVVFGWVVCARCGQMAACPECVEVSETMPLSLCNTHREYEAAYASTLRLIWVRQERTMGAQKTERK